MCKPPSFSIFLIEEMLIRLRVCFDTCHISNPSTSQINGGYFLILFITFFRFILFLCVLSVSMSGHHLYARYLDPSELELQMVVSVMRTSGGAARALTLCAVSPDTCTLLIN